jgi:hypothetical protein
VQYEFLVKDAMTCPKKLLKTIRANQKDCTHGSLIIGKSGVLYRPPAIHAAQSKAKGIPERKAVYKIASNILCGVTYNPLNWILHLNADIDTENWGISGGIGPWISKQSYLGESVWKSNQTRGF